MDPLARALLGTLLSAAPPVQDNGVCTFMNPPLSRGALNGLMTELRFDPPQPSTTTPHGSTPLKPQP